MNDMMPRLIGAIVATVVLMGALGWYLGNRDKMVESGVKEIRSHLDDYAANDSLIARQAPADAPKLKNFEVFWQCRGEPKCAKVTGATTAEGAIKNVKRQLRGKKCEFLKSAETTKPFCQTRDTCGHSRIVK